MSGFSKYDPSKEKIITVVVPGKCEVRSYNGNRPRLVVNVGTTAKGETRWESVSEAAFDAVFEAGAPAGDALEKACTDFDKAGGKIKAAPKAPSATAATLAGLQAGQAQLADGMAQLAAALGKLASK